MIVGEVSLGDAWVTVVVGRGRRLNNEGNGFVAFDASASSKSLDGLLYLLPILNSDLAGGTGGSAGRLLSCAADHGASCDGRLVVDVDAFGSEVSDVTDVDAGALAAVEPLLLVSVKPRGLFRRVIAWCEKPEGDVSILRRGSSFLVGVFVSLTGQCVSTSSELMGQERGRREGGKSEWERGVI